MDKNIIEINNKKLCANCFSSLNDGDYCEYCASNNGSKVNDCLPVGTILHGRFIVGKAIYYDNSYYGYYGYDPASNERVLIREFFPAGGFCSRINKSLVCDLRDSAMALEFKSAVNNFHTEVKILSGIKDTSAVTPVRDLFDENGTSYSVVPFPQKAVLLSEYIKNKGGKLTPKESFRIFDGIVKALDVIHKNAIIHGNIRPENIIIINKKVILTGLNYGGYGYLENRSSPVYTNLNRFAPLEQLSKSDRRGPWTDIFALGTTLYYMLTGSYVENIFSRIDLLEDGDTCSAIKNTGDIPQKLAPILEKMLHVRMDDRYRNLTELTKALATAHFTKLKIKPTVNNKKSKSKGLVAIIIILVLVLCASAAAVFIIWSNKDKDKDNPIEEQIEENDSGSESTNENQSDSDQPSESATEESEILPEKENTDDQDNKGGSNPIDLGGIWQKNKMLPSENTEFVFGNENYLKEQIISVVFLSECSDTEIPEDSWDISVDNEKRVLAWVKQTDESFELYIYGNNGINAELSCKDLFADYINLSSVNFNGCFYTVDTTDMSGMFKNCKSLTSLDLFEFNAEKVENLCSMFSGCESLSELKLPTFTVADSADVSDMFEGCTSLEIIETENEIIKTAFESK